MVAKAGACLACVITGIVTNAAPSQYQSNVEIALAGFDADKDGKISMEELTDRVGASQDPTNSAAVQGWIQGFTGADADNDQHLDAEELATLFANANAQQAEGFEESAQSMLAEFDADKDGMISLMEFTDQLTGESALTSSPAFRDWHANFKEADKNSDMQLNFDELKSLLAKAREKEQEAERREIRRSSERSQSKPTAAPSEPTVLSVLGQCAAAFLLGSLLAFVAHGIACSLSLTRRSWPFELCFEGKSAWQRKKCRDQSVQRILTRGK